MTKKLERLLLKMAREDYINEHLSADFLNDDGVMDYTKIIISDDFCGELSVYKVVDLYANDKDYTEIEKQALPSTVRFEVKEVDE